MKLNIFVGLTLMVLCSHSQARERSHNGYQSGYEATDTTQVSGYTKQNGTYVEPYV